MTRWHRLGVVIGITALVGCGSPSPEGPVSSPTTGSAAAVVSPPVADAPPPDTRRIDASRATSPARETRVPPAAAPATPPPSDAKTTADQAQREAREMWFAELRESPDVTVRLQALEFWAEQPGNGIDPLTYALVDEDEQVRARAEELWEQQHTYEERSGERAEW